MTLHDPLTRPCQVPAGVQALRADLPGGVQRRHRHQSLAHVPGQAAGGRDLRRVPAAAGSFHVRAPNPQKSGFLSHALSSTRTMTRLTRRVVDCTPCICRSATPHSPCGVLYSGPMRMGAGRGLQSGDPSPHFYYYFRRRRYTKFPVIVPSPTAGCGNLGIVLHQLSRGSPLAPTLHTPHVPRVDGL